MPKISGGVLSLTKKEIKEFKTMIFHCQRDMYYGSGVSFNDGQGNLDKKEYQAVENAIENLKWILERSID